MGTKKSIRTLNVIFFGIILMLNIAILIVDVFFLKNNVTLLFLVLGFNLLGFLLFLAYYTFSRQYVMDFEKILTKFQGALNAQTYAKIPDAENTVFIENKRLEGIFKQALVKNNLRHKDFMDLREVFLKFVPQDIYQEISSRGYEKISLGSCALKKLTIMFLDIVGFTRISEAMPPEQTLILLNIYFDGIGEIIHNHGGYIDKFLGDGVMVLFDHESSDQAVDCSLAVMEFMQKFQITDLGHEVGVGIGINSGEVIVGTVGTNRRMDATVIGDNVNIAARLQGLTRKHNRSILVSRSVLDLLTDESRFKTEEIGVEMLAGKQQAVNVWSIEAI